MGIDPALNRAAELVATGGDFLGMASPDEIEKARAAILLAEQAIEDKPGA